MYIEKIESDEPLKKKTYVFSEKHVHVFAETRTCFWG